jgi:hypothetical protein
MRSAALFLLVAVLVPAATARAEFTQDVSSPLVVDADPYNVATADFDHNGRPDIAAANGTTGSISVYLRGVAGGFTPAPGSPFPAGTGASDVAAADFNADGWADLAVASHSNPGGRVFLRKTDGSGFQLEGNAAIPIPNVTGVAAGDLNGDQRPDVVFAGVTGPSVYYALRKASNDGFHPPVQLTTGTGVKAMVGIVDLTGDGQPDILASTQNQKGLDVWVQRDDGTFAKQPDSPFPVGGDAYGIAIADFNADGRPDVAVAAYTSDSVVLFVGQVGGGLVAEATYPAGDGPVGLETADFDGDGLPDLAAANQAGKTVTVLLRRGTGFVADPSSPIVTNLFATGLAVADFDADTRLDLAVANILVNRISVLLNTTPFRLPPPPPPVNLDVDGDRVQRPADCDDTNPAVFPGAAEIPGDGIDQDCIGGDASYPRLRRTVSYDIKYGTAYSVFTSLSVKPGRAGDHIRLRCKGRGCRIGTKVLDVAKNTARISLTKHVRGARMRPGASLEVRITRPGTVGKSVKYTVRAGRKPRKRERCLPPGSTTPVKCSA